MTSGGAVLPPSFPGVMLGMDARRQHEKRRWENAWKEEEPYPAPARMTKFFRDGKSQWRAAFHARASVGCRGCQAWVAVVAVRPLTPKNGKHCPGPTFLPAVHRVLESRAPPLPPFRGPAPPASAPKQPGQTQVRQNKQQGYVTAGTGRKKNDMGRERSFQPQEPEKPAFPRHRPPGAVGLLPLPSFHAFAWTWSTRGWIRSSWWPECPFARPLTIVISRRLVSASVVKSGTTGTKRRKASHPWTEATSVATRAFSFFPLSPAPLA